MSGSGQETFIRNLTPANQSIGSKIEFKIKTAELCFAIPAEKEMTNKQVKLFFFKSLPYSIRGAVYTCMHTEKLE